jgi:hypothetical protein
MPIVSICVELELKYQTLSDRKMFEVRRQFRVKGLEFLVLRSRNDVVLFCLP